MRTTLDLPDDLVREAKIAAVRRGRTLRDLVASGLRRELSLADPAPSIKKLPSLRVSADAPVLRMTPAGIKAALATEDAADDKARAG